MKLQLRHLHYFIAVAEELNFRQAAERLFVSQPTLSLQIAQLEEILGVRLLKRDKRSVELNAAGQSFYREALHILDTVEQSVARVRNQAGAQPMTIGVPNYHTFDLVSDAIHDFSETQPGIEVQISEMPSIDMYSALANEALDIGFMSLPLPPPGENTLKTISIATEPYLICLPAAHPTYNNDVVNAANLENSKFFLLPRKVHPSFHDAIVSNLRKAGFKVNISYEATSTQAQYSLVAAGLGVCLALESSPLPPGLRALALEPPVLHHELALAWHPRCAQANLQTFIDSVLDSANKRQ